MEENINSEGKSFSSQLTEDEIQKAIAARAGGVEPMPAQPEVVQPEVPQNLGMAESWGGNDSNRVHIDDLPQNMVGWKPIPLVNLPSQGIYYPDGTTIEIRSASVKLIRDFSMIDENDPVSIEEKSDRILAACMRVRYGNGAGSYKDLKAEDRFYMLFAIREMTFINGEGKLSMTITCGTACAGDGSWSENVEINKDVFEYYSIDERLTKKFDDKTKSFIIEHPKVGRIQLFVPSAGVANEIGRYMREQIRAGVKLDESFTRILPFIVSDWRGLNNATIKQKEIEAAEWSMDKFSAIKQLSEMIRFGAKTTVTRRCGQCGREVTSPITFQGGIRSLFFVSDIIDEIL